MPHDCPDEETLAAYFDGLLPEAAEVNLHRELIACPDCARLVAALGMVLESEAPDAWHHATVPAAVTQAAVALWPTTTSPLTSALNLAARWIGDTLAPLADALTPLQPALSPVRGTAPTATEELHYQVTLGDVPLEIDLEVDGPEQVALTIRPLNPPPTGLLLRLTTSGETRALSTLDASGTTVPALSCGHYDLTLERGNQPLDHLTLTLHPPKTEPS